MRIGAVLPRDCVDLVMLSGGRLGDIMVRGLKEIREVSIDGDTIWCWLTLWTEPP